MTSEKTKSLPIIAYLKQSPLLPLSSVPFTKERSFFDSMVSLFRLSGLSGLSGPFRLFGLFGHCEERSDESEISQTKIATPVNTLYLSLPLPSRERETTEGVC